MAAAMARGWRLADPELDLVFADAGSGRAGACADELGGTRADGLAGLAAECDLLILATKPASLETVAQELQDAAGIIVSVLGGVTIERLQAALPGTPIMRAMPNVAVEVGHGVVCWSPGDRLTAPQAEHTAALLGRLGTAVELPERLLDPATAVIGCGPAYVAVLAEALTDAAIEHGFDSKTAARLVAATFAGTGTMLADHTSLQVRRAVASPGGVTAAGLAALEAQSPRGALADAVRAALERMG